MQHSTLSPETHDPLEILSTQDRDQAVFITRAISRDEVLGRLTGPVLAERTRYTIEREGRFYDPAPPIRFVNHSCDPSATWVGHELRALRALEIGAEVTFDYHQTETAIAWNFTCLCGSENCRGVVKSQARAQ